MTLSLAFEGFFQCRLATDSDAYTETRGVDGWTYAFGNEPDLDRIIRFRDPVGLRSHAPPIAVSVVKVNDLATHPLLGAAVELREEPVFEGRNHVIAGDGREPISPNVLRISAPGISLERRSTYDITKVAQRTPYMGRGVRPLPDPSVRGQSLRTEADAVAFRAARRAVLQQDLQAATDAGVREILEARIDRLEMQNDGVVTAVLISSVAYDYTLKDAVAIVDPNNVLSRVDRTTPWPLRYWMGAWDADTLTGFVRGTLEIPET